MNNSCNKTFLEKIEKENNFNDINELRKFIKDVKADIERKWLNKFIEMWSDHDKAEKKARAYLKNGNEPLYRLTKEEQATNFTAQWGLMDGYIFAYIAFCDELRYDEILELWHDKYGLWTDSENNVDGAKRYLAKTNSHLERISFKEFCSQYRENRDCGFCSLDDKGSGYNYVISGEYSNGDYALCNRLTHDLVNNEPDYVYVAKPNNYNVK